MPKYPAQIDNSQSLPTAIDNLTPVQGSIFNKLRDAVLAVESELGVKPSGSYTTVRSRLDTLEGIVGNLLIIELHKDLGGTLEEPLVIGLQGRPVSTVAPAFGQVLAWNGIAWIPSTSSGGGGGFDPPAADFAGQTLVWDGSAYIPDFILGDDVIPPYNQTLTSTINLVEVGQTVSEPAFTATYEISPTTASITDDEFDTPTNVSSSPESFISPFDYNKSAYGDTVTFTLTALQGHVTKTVDYQIEWAQKVYYGVTTAGQTGETFIKSLSGQPITNTKNVSFAINAGTNQKIYYACRSAYGDMVFTIHDIEGGFTKTQAGVDVTNDFGFTEEYDLYESDYAELGPLNVFVGDGDDFFQSGGGPIGPPGPTGPAGTDTPLSRVAYVDLFSTSPGTPNGSIGSPFLNIQDAIDSLVDGYGSILLAPGVYPTATYNTSGKKISFSTVGTNLVSNIITSLDSVSFTTNSELSFNNCFSVGQITSTSTVSLINTHALSSGNTCLLLYGESNQGSYTAISNWTVSAHATLINCTINNLSAGGLLNITNSFIGQNCECSGGGQVYSCKFLTSFSSLISTGSALVYDESSYRSAKSLGATINIGALTEVMGPKYDNITVEVPVLASNAIGTVNVDISGTDLENVGIGSGIMVTPPQAGVAGGGFIASAYLSTIGTITYVFHGPTTGGDQVFRTTWLN
jgi:hypothetical protein